MRNKKYNPRKLSQSNARGKVQNNVMVFVQGIPSTLTYNRTTKIISHKIDKQLVDEVVHARHKWNVTLAVLGLNQYDSEVIVWDELTVDSPVLQTDLADTLTEFHKQLLDDERITESMTNVLRFGWVACPSDNVLTDEEMYSIFHRLRGFKSEILPNNL